MSKPMYECLGDKRLIIISQNPLIPALVPFDYSVDDACRISRDDLTIVGPLTKQSISTERRWDTDIGLVKLVLQIAHACNFRCSYCCANAGHWSGKNTGLMEPDLAVNALRFFARMYGSIGYIYLFGGEPTLNLKAIEAVCDEAELLVKNGVLQRLPEIGFTTNGSNADDALIRLLLNRQYLTVSVSIDGPALIHDRYRVDVFGRPTYDRILQNIQILREKTGQPSTIEITYTRAHQNSGMSLWDIMKSVHRDTGIDTIALEVAFNTYSTQLTKTFQADFDRTLSDIKYALVQSMESILNSDKPIYYYPLIAFTQILFLQHKPNFCPAARSYFTVAKDGAIYPCQNLPETMETLIGYIGEPDLENKIRNSHILNVISDANRIANEYLGDRWFANFCKICPVHNLSETNSMVGFGAFRTKLYEGMASAFLTQLLCIAENEELYNQFNHNVQMKAIEAMKFKDT